ncbi:WD repeat-containing protein 36 [Lepidopterella palustris CBS 459.81]|uniref:WD repeat-containing protein 36 n=1 Tax=Lepidopterella palustris CBS 459.81 TaxID=1314670 RepID=A0A8E2ELP3_9PEZI|nr:WD repeat-containing protein 36 [Lepidopterella palustris CBS 459.81]
MPSVMVTESASNRPVSKRQKLNESSTNGTQRRVLKPRIFTPFRTIGLVSPTDVPFTARPLGKTTFQITTSVGRCLQTYDLKRGLNLVFITRPQTPETITASTSWKDQVLAAWGGEEPQAARGVWVFKRGKKVDELELPRFMEENIKQLLVFGAWIVGCCSSKIEVWKSSTLEHYTTLHGTSANLLSGGVCNMPTYLNKIFAGMQDGTIAIWNLSTGKLIYTILPNTSNYGAVTALQPATALSLLAIAYASGPVVIHDIRADKEILRLNTGASAKSPVTSISFRTDGLGAGDDGRKDGVMATSCKDNGDVTFWDLNGGGRKKGVLHGAHDPPSSAHGGIGGGISKVEFLAGQSVLVTSGLDNSLKTWIFDEMPFSPIPRILHSRSGHAAPVSTLQFLPSDSDGADAGGKWLLSASRDRSLWGWSLRRDGQSTELSQGNIRKRAKKMGILNNGLLSLDSTSNLEDLKAPSITCMACSLNRDGGIGAIPGATGIWNNSSKSKGSPRTNEISMTGWESVVTGHEGDKMARTWFWGRKRAGRWAFETGDGTVVKSVAVSPCGTFALIGSAGGGIDMFNLQSGIHRQRFPARLTVIQAKKLKIQQEEAEDMMISMDPNAPKKYTRGQGKHTKAVTGIVVDSLNRIVISCGADGKVKFWDFVTGLLLHEIDWYPMTSITSMHYHRPSDLIALSCDDGSIRVVDIETKKLVRELWTSNAHTETRTIDFTFSNDGRWVISACTDSIIRVWDLPTGHLIDAMKLHSPCTALAFSNTGEYLATTQEDSVGVHIWTNRTLFTHVPTRHISEEDIASIDAPTASGEGGEGFVEAAVDETEEEQEEDETHIPSIDQLSDHITTLSLVPKSRWQNLLHLDIIRARNKPKEASKPLEKAPFFLPSLNQPPDPSTALTTIPAPEPSRITSSSLTTPSTIATTTTTFTSHLALAASSTTPSATTYTPLLTHLSTLPPSAADIAIRTLADTPPYTELHTFIHALTSRLRERRDYELVQAWMAVFLRLHGDTVVRDRELVQAMREWQDEAKREKERIGRLVGYAVGVVGWIRSARS